MTMVNCEYSVLINKVRVLDLLLILAHFAPLQDPVQYLELLRALFDLLVEMA